MLKLFFFVLTLFAEIVLAFPLRAQQAVFVVRHAERLDAEDADSPLRADGEIRAVALAKILKDAEIMEIYTSDKKRTIKTAEPLAKILRHKNKSVQSFVIQRDEANKNIDDAIERIRKREETGNVLVVNHHSVIPRIIKNFQCSTVIKDIEEEEYDNLFVLILHEKNA